MNRILINSAAAINIAAAALIYIACSGDDGAQGPAGAPCTAAASTTVTGGIDIICGGVTAGTLPPGPAGTPGQGVPADGCYLAAVTGGYNVVCGGVDQGPLSTGGGPGGGCLITTTPGSAWIDINCGTGNQIQIAKSICNYTPSSGPNAGVPQAEAYDYATEVCNSTSGILGNCNGTGFDRNERFCTSDNKILARCGAKFFDADAGDNAGKMKPDSTGVYDPATQFCLKKDGSGANLFYAEGITTGQLGGTTNLLQGEVTAKCFTTASNEYTVAKVTNTGDVTQYNSGNYSVNDFCNAAKIYPRCGATGVFNPTTSFCLIPSSIASIKLGTAVPAPNPPTAGGTVTPRCGTLTTGNIPAAAYVVSGLGTYFSDKHFCSGSGSAVKINMLCQGSASGAATAPTINATASGHTTLTDGTYKPESEYCKLTNIAVAGDYGASVEDLVGCSGAPTVKYDDGTQFCLNGVVYPLCGTATNQDFDPTKEFCDERGIASPNGNTTAIALATGTTQIKSVGGTVYPFVSIGTQNWMAKDLSYDPSGLGNGTYDWATAVSAETGCPAGWSLPTNVQWTALIGAVNSASGTNTPALLLRPVAATTPPWGSTPTTGNESGFNALPFSTAQSTASGPAFIASLDLDATPGANGIPPIATAALTNTYGGWWTKDEDAANAVIGSDKNNALFRWFKDTDVVVRTGSGSKLANKLLVRCVKD